MISVSGVSMRYGSKVLFEDVTTTFSSGRRYGLTGPNGSGKSTFMKLLTGDLDPQRGTVASPRKLGVLRQDHYAFDQYRVIDTVIMGNARLWAALAERGRALCSPRYVERGRHAPRRARRHRRRRGRILLGERCRSAAAGARHPQPAARPDDGRTAGRAEGAGARGTGPLRPARSATARRTDEPPRPRFDPLAAAVYQPLRRRTYRHLARQALSERHLHAHRRHRLRDDHHVYRRLRRHGGWPRLRFGRPSKRGTHSARRRLPSSTTSLPASARAHVRARSRHDARRSNGSRPPSWRARIFSAHISDS